MSGWYDRACDGCGLAVAARVPAGAGRVLCTSCEPGDLPFTPAEVTGHALAEAHAEIERLRGLVARYARHVELCEGTDFLDREPWELLDTFTPADLSELRTIRREAGLT